jgi:type I restriction enzyme S subunit
MSKRTYKELSEICSIIKRGISPKYTENDGLMVINQRCIRDYVISFDNARKHNINLKKVGNEKILKAYDVLVNSTGVGTLGRVAQLGSSTIKATVDSHVTIVRLGSPDLDPVYFGWLLKSKQREIEFLGEGSTGQTELSRYRLGEIAIDFPNQICKQRYIGEVLTTLDDKIHLLRQQNATLASMAQALFKSWFVDFDPVIDNALAAGRVLPEALGVRVALRGAGLAGRAYSGLPEEVKGLFPGSFVFSEELGKWVPEGWATDKFSESVTVKYGKDHKKLLEGPYPVYGSGGLMRRVDSVLYDKESVLIPRKGTLSNVMYVNEPFWSVDTMFYTILKKEYLAKYVFYFISGFNLTEMNVGSAVPSMTTAVLNNLDMLLPDSSLLELFDNKVEKFYLKKQQNVEKIQTLTRLRDVLLPELISGRLGV